MRISDWSSDVCSSDLFQQPVGQRRGQIGLKPQPARAGLLPRALGLGAGHGIVIRVIILVVHVGATADLGHGRPRTCAPGSMIVLASREPLATASALPKISRRPPSLSMGPAPVPWMIERAPSSLVGLPVSVTWRVKQTTH